jgi:DNA-binding Lrp family transcriptional regulator
MKDVELRLISELMKNSCRSDRQLAKALGVSQPTVSRAKATLEKEGYISEYTIIPNFKKIGYHLFALTFFSWKQSVSKNEMEEAIKGAQQKAPSWQSNVVLIERGIGLNYDSFMGSFHKDYSSYTKLMSELKKSPYIDLRRMESFIVNLDDEIHYRTLTFSTLAKHLLETNQKKE